MSSHVDDFLHTGDTSFKEEVMSNLKHIFEVSNESADAFAYLGIKLTTTKEVHILDQIQYIQELKPINISEVRRLSKDDEVSEGECKNLRSVIGKLNWISSQTRPDISFAVSQAASRVNKAKVSDLIEINKLVKKTKSEEVRLKFPKLKNLENSRLVVFADASLGNLEGGGSQGAYTIFIADEDNNCALLSWNSTRIKRVARSVLAAETMALSEGVDRAQMINHSISQLIFEHGKKLTIECLTDSRSLFQSIGTSHTLVEKRLLIDISSLREACDREEIQVSWIDTKSNLANSLTKKTAYSGALIEVLNSGRLYM